jgi:dipicolinate synthase subunit A
MGCLGLWAAVVVGGDARERVLRDRIRTAGGDVVLYGHDDGDDEALERLARHRWIMAPVSGIGPGGIVKAPRGPLRVTREAANTSLGVVAGAVDGDWAAGLAVPILAYRERDDFAWANAVPTAEGALAWALTAHGRVLHGSVVGITGFGRVAQVLAPRLAGVGAAVCIIARSPAERAHAAALGYRAAPWSPREAHGLALFFNTVPAMILDDAWVAALPADTPILDLASPPGGFPPEARADLDGRLAWHPSLPGEIAPDTAADIILQTLEALCPVLHAAAGSGRFVSHPVD